MLNFFQNIKIHACVSAAKETKGARHTSVLFTGTISHQSQPQLILKVWQKCFNNQFGEGENVKILIIVVELQNVWQIKFSDLVKFAKFAKLFSHQTSLLAIWHIFQVLSNLGHK